MDDIAHVGLKNLQQTTNDNCSIHVFLCSMIYWSVLNMLYNAQNDKNVGVCITAAELSSVINVNI